MRHPRTCLSFSTSPTMVSQSTPFRVVQANIARRTFDRTSTQCPVGTRAHQASSGVKGPRHRQPPTIDQRPDDGSAGLRQGSRQNAKCLLATWDTRFHESMCLYHEITQRCIVIGSVTRLFARRLRRKKCSKAGHGDWGKIHLFDRVSMVAAHTPVDLLAMERCLFTIRHLSAPVAFVPTLHVLTVALHLKAIRLVRS